MKTDGRRKEKRGQKGQHRRDENGGKKQREVRRKRMEEEWGEGEESGY